MKVQKSFLEKIFFLLGSDKKKLPVIIFSFIALSLFDLIGLGLIAPFISLIISQDNSTLIFLTDILESYGIILEQNKLIIIVGLGIIIMFLFKVIFGIIINIMILRFGWNQQTKVRVKLMKRFQAMNYSEYLNRNSSDYIQIIHSMVGQYIMNAILPILKISSESIVIFVVMILLAYNNLPVLLSLFLILSIIMIFYFILFKKSLVKYGEEINKGSTSMLKAISEGMEGFKELKVLSKEKIFTKSVYEGASQNAVGQIKSQTIITAPRFILEFLIIVFIVGIVVIKINIDGNVIDLAPTLGLFGIATVRLMPSINILFNSINSIKSGTYAVNRIYSDLIVSFKKLSKTEIIENKRIEKFESIELKNINFSYPDTKKLVLKNISLKINKGESIGIIGESGSGKTTLIDIILGLLKIDSGNIFLNKKNVYENLIGWRKLVAYLPQKVFVMDDSLKKNISLEENDKEIDYDKLELSIKKARLSNMVEKLEEGINTKIGERGSRISGGQGQRVSLARAFYHDRKILIMDEATSSLDLETEKEIVDEIKFLKGKTTLIVIAHRLSTLKHCDKIYEIQNGSIVGSGSYSEMIN